MTKTELLSNIRDGYLQFMTLIAEFNEEQRSSPGVIAKWSVKDTVAHLVVHEQRMLVWMEERVQGRNPMAFQPYAMPDAELNELNEQIYQQNRDRQWEELIEDLEKTYSKVLKFIELSPEEDLLSGERFHLLGGEPLYTAIAANTYEHYAEHGSEIRAWMGKLSG
jgi:hypothetical protein